MENTQSNDQLKQKEPYRVSHVQELTPKFEALLESLKNKGYTYPELIVAIQSALYAAVYWRVKEELS